jgi:signal transduction histidine kinase
MANGPGQGARNGAATLARENGNGGGNGGGNGADSARDLLFIEQLRFGQAELASETVFLCGLLHDSVATARRHADERDIEVVITRCDRVVSSRRGDRRRLIQAFDQLIRNAIQFTPAGGTVEVRGMLVEQDFVIEIVDEGPGIPPEEAALVYDAFFRGSAASEHRISGRGVGLTVARAIIEAHSGSLHIRPNDGRGSTACVELPA